MIAGRLALATVLSVSVAVAIADPVVTVIPRADVDAAFAVGRTLLATPAYKINASRRDAPGEVEIHAHETDVFQVAQGHAVLVTGGRVVDPITVAPGETRGRGVEGGEVHELGPGDVVVIPAGVPHWFRDVRGPLLYFTVKPIS